MRSSTLLTGILLLALGGCATQRPQAVNAPRHPVMEAVHAKEPIQLDGKLDEAVWKRARAYPLQLAETGSKLDLLHNPHLAAGNPEPLEGGTVRLAWDEKYLYVGVQFEDSDVVAEATQDQVHQYQMGDTAELFLKPMNQTWLWEMYATPAGHKTAFFFPGAGQAFLPSDMNYHTRLKVAGHVEGSLNQWRDRDEGWSAEYAVPLDELKEVGQALTPDTPWLILVSRYNYSRYLLHRELSSAPRQPYPAFKLTDYYAELKLVR
jgi:hypothetical protein